jgi:hypothetical protein
LCVFATGIASAMWGSWYGVLTAAVVGGLLLIVAALTAWTPLFAIGIAALVIGAIAIYFAIQSGREEVQSGESATESRPASPPDEPEHQPRRGSEVAGGVWGEKREA